MKKILCLLLSLSMLLSITTAAAEEDLGSLTIEFEETGTKADPYLISTEADYVHLTDCVKAGESFFGKYFKQTKDLDLHVSQDNASVFGLGAADTFAGIYDGCGYKIMLANSYSNADYTKLNQGLFGKLEGTVLNLTMCGYIENSAPGGLLAYEIIGNGKIINCSFVGSARSDQSGNQIFGLASTANYDVQTNGPAIINSFYYGVFATNHESVPVTDTEGTIQNVYYCALNRNGEEQTGFLGTSKTADEILELYIILNDNITALSEEYDYVTWVSGEFGYANNSTYNVPYLSKYYYSPVTFEGAGTKVNPYIIGSFADYQKLTGYIISGQTFKGKYFRQTANIKPEADGTYGPAPGTEFAGIYDGGGYTITVSSADSEKTLRKLNTGVFGDKLSGKIMNLNVEAHLVIDNNSGAFAREIVGVGKIVNCSYNGKLRGDQGVGKAFYGFASTVGYDTQTNGAAIINSYIRGSLHTKSGKTSYPVTDKEGAALYTYYDLNTGYKGYTTSDSDIIYTYSGDEKTNDEMIQLYTTLNDNLANAAQVAGVNIKDLMTWTQGTSAVTSSQDSGALIPVHSKRYYGQREFDGYAILDPTETVNPVKNGESVENGKMIISGTKDLDAPNQALYYRFDLSRILNGYKVTSAKLLMDSSNERVPITFYDCPDNIDGTRLPLTGATYLTVPKHIGSVAVSNYSMSDIADVTSDEYPGITDGVFEHSADITDYVREKTASDKSVITFMIYTTWNGTSVRFGNHPKLYLKVEPVDYSVNRRSVGGNVLVSGDTINAVYSVSNFSEDDLDLSLLLAYYDDGKLIGSAVQSYTISPRDREDNISVEMTVPQIKDHTNCYAIAFLWDSAALYPIDITPAKILAECDINSDNVKLLGRTEESYFGRSCNWPQSGIEFEFNGTDAWVYVSHISKNADAYFNVSIDGNDTCTRFNVTDTGWYPIAENLSEGKHTVSFTRSSEGQSVHVYINKIRTKGSAAEPTAQKSRKMEFIGDSYTAGYGNLGLRGETQSAANSDAWQSYAGFAMRMLNAEGNIIAHSGRGVLVDYEGTTNYNLPSQYLNADVIVGGQPTKWNFENYTPQAVVVFLGTNDYAGIGKENEFTAEDFTAAYREFLTTIREKNPNAHIIVCSKESGCMKEEIDAVVREMQSIDDKLHRFIFTTFAGGGCGGHPTAEEAEVMAQELVNAINEMGNIWGE